MSIETGSGHDNERSKEGSENMSTTLLLLNPHSNEMGDIEDSRIVESRLGRQVQSETAPANGILPDTPPQGVTNVLTTYPLNFRDAAHAEAWRGVQFQTVVWARDTQEQGKRIQNLVAEEPEILKSA
jgi:hypothetical protein